MRTTVEAVAGILGIDSSVWDLTPFIEASNSLVTEICVPLGYPDERLELIERWLAAHFYSIRDPRLFSEKIGDAGVAYQAKIGMHLEVTTYGQQVLLLDTLGGLSALNQSAAGKRPGVLWLGTAQT